MISDDSAAKDWVVLLEAGDEGGGSTIEPVSFARMVSSWADPVPTTLYSPNRYAIQVIVRAAGAPLALSHAMALWKDSLRRGGLPEWDLLRAEVLTPKELEAEWRAVERADPGPDASQEAPRSEDVVTDALIRRALHDSVSGLAGRELFIDEVRRALATGGPAAATQAVMVVHIQPVDGGGPSQERPLPDEVLVEVAERLSALVRRDDTVGHIGPAEFALLIHAPSAATDCPACRIADRLGRPFVRRGSTLSLTASVGVATAYCGDDADGLILRAEEAMTAASDAGGDCHRHFAANTDCV